MDQPRVPAGDPRGGQWTSTGSRSFVFEKSDNFEEDGVLNEQQLRDFTNVKWGFAMSRNQIANLAGAQNGSRVSISMNTEDPSNTLTVYTEFVGDDGFPIGSSLRYINENSINNFEISFEKGFKNKGLGLKVFSQQVEHAVKEGYRSISALASGNAESLDWQNGYYTWARFGFNGPIPNGKVGPGGERTVQEVMKRSDGAAWWKANGSTFEGTFSLSPGSESLRVFNEYRRLKGQV
jgi:hypothetical protein